LQKQTDGAMGRRTKKGGKDVFVLTKGRKKRTLGGNISHWEKKRGGIRRS